jgi:hypothetical protein
MIKFPDYDHPAGEVAVIADQKNDARIRSGF